MAEKILRQMQSSYQAGDFDLKPNVITYNAVIKAWSQCRNDPNAAHRAELYLRSMQRMYKEGNLDVKPDLFSFNAVLNAWAKSLKWEAVTRAGKILRYMEVQSENGGLDFAPNTVSYTAVIDAWAKSGCKNSGEVAEQLLIRMQEKFDRGEPTKPNLLTMNTVIDAHAKSSEKGKARNAQSVLRRIEAKYKEGDEQMLPNAFTYTTVLNACAFTFEKSDQEEAFQVAQSTYQEVIKSASIRPTHLTYGTYIKAINTLLPRDDDRRYPLIESAFTQCCKDGQLARFVLQCLQDALPTQSYLKLLRGNRKGVVSVNAEDLPSEWRRNVKEKALYFNQIREKKKVMKKRYRKR
uniref:Pentacotripeptide-repeat region of PRORP domain-containing protein n=1 Tax=Leptocylindrus danicus TaxID=163516 RepID=A0A7S2L7W9_9STRA